MVRGSAFSIRLSLSPIRLSIYYSTEDVFYTRLATLPVSLACEIFSLLKSSFIGIYQLYDQLACVTQQQYISSVRYSTTTETIYREAVGLWNNHVGKSDGKNM